MLTVPILCTKGVANLRRDHDGVGAAGRGAGLGAGHDAGEAVPARAPHHLRRGAARVRSRPRARPHPSARIFPPHLHPYIYCRNRFESQLGNSGRYVHGKSCPLRKCSCHSFDFVCFRACANEERW